MTGGQESSWVVWLAAGVALLAIACGALVVGAVVDSALVSAVGAAAAIGTVALFGIHQRRDDLRLLLINGGLLVGVVLVAALFELVR